VNDLNTIQSEINVGDTLRSMKQYTQAASHFQQALAMRRARFGDDAPIVAQTQNLLGAVYTQAGDYAQAEPLLQKSFANYEAKSGADSLNVASGAAELADLHQAKKEYDQAVALYERCLKIRQAKLK